MTTRAEIKRLQSPDVEDLTRYAPEDPADFGLLLQVIAGPAGQDGEESFDVVVCTPQWLGRRLGSEGIVIGRHHLLVDSYNYARLEGFLKRHVAACSGSTWAEVASKLARLGKWEFEDYRA